MRIYNHEKSNSLVSRLSFFILILFLCIPPLIYGQGPVHQSVQTLQLLKPGRADTPSPENMDELIRKFNFTLNYWNDHAEHEGGVGSSRRLFKD